MKTNFTSRTIGTWNVHTLMDSTKAYRPESDSSSCKRTGHIQHSYWSAMKQGWQIKVSWSKPGFFSSDCYSEEHREAGVGSAVKTYRISKFTNIPQGSNDRLMAFRLSRRGLTFGDSCISHAVYRLPTHTKTYWMHPRSNLWHLIDYVPVYRGDRQDVRVIRAMCRAYCRTSSENSTCTFSLKAPWRLFQ